MRIAKLVCAVVPAATAIACSDPSSSSPTAPAARPPDGPQLITGGQATGSAYGGVGAVLIDVGGDLTIDFICTGSLISPTVFMTAGHCVFGAGTVYYVSFAPDVVPLPPLIPSATAFASPNDDLGVVVLPAGSTTGVPVYDIPSLGFLTESNARGGLARDRAIVVGYGVSSLGGMKTSGVDGVRKVATTRILSLLGRQIIIAGANGKSVLGGVCFGDSGGPLFLASDPDLVVGVASGVLLDGCQALAGHVRIDTPTARAFLGQHVAL